MPHRHRQPALIAATAISLILGAASLAVAQGQTTPPSAGTCTGTVTVPSPAPAVTISGCTVSLKVTRAHETTDPVPLFGIAVRAAATIPIPTAANAPKPDATTPPRTTAVSLKFVPTAGQEPWQPDIVQGPSAAIEAVQTPFSLLPGLIVWGNVEGTLTILPADSKDSVKIDVTVEAFPDSRLDNQQLPGDWQRRLYDGYFARMTIGAPVYDALTAFARCVQGGPDEAACLRNARETPADASSWQRNYPAKNGQMKALPSKKKKDYVEYASDKDATVAGIYHIVSRWLGRDPAYEFTDDKGKEKQRASQSDPIVLFAGLAGLNKIALLDCQHRHEQTLPEDNALKSKFYRCHDFARPSAQTLERAKNFWAAYVEDGDAPYDTTIEAEFGSTSRNPDYEEFDPRVAPTSVDQSASRTVLLGFRRFRIREAPSVAQVAFTRQGPAYGLRQWIRVYRQRSQWWIVPAATVFAPGIPVEQNNAVLTPIYADGSTQPFANVIGEDSKTRFLFAGLALQWPQLRAKADDSGPLKRLLYNAVPDVSLGFADVNMLFSGGSWPIPLWRDRTYLTLGTTWVREDHVVSGYTLGQRLPLSTPSDVVTEQRWNMGYRVGITLELFKVRK